jgi:hypothetical protein
MGGTMPAGSAVGSAALSDLFPAAARRMVLAGRPQAAEPAASGGPASAAEPKELLLALAEAAAEAAGLEVLRANPHFMPASEWCPELAVAHFASLEVACPVPVARNVMLLDGEDMLGLAEERRAGDQRGIRSQRLALMDRVLTVAPDLALDGLLPEAAGAPAPQVAPAPLDLLLAQAGRLRAADAARPVQWLACEQETGPYNFLQLRREPKLGSSHLRVLTGTAEGGERRPILVSFATPGTLGELGPALRAFSALGAEARGGLLFVLFFGSPADFASAVAERPHALFFGDNFRCPDIRILFGPFGASEVLEAVRGATVSLDTCYGGVLDGLARRMGVGNRIVLGPDGSFDAWASGQALAGGIAWDRVLDAGTLARRRLKSNRAGERALASALARML